MTLSFPIYRLKRQAKNLARQSHVPLHQALDEIAQREGFRSWAHLSAKNAQSASVGAVFDACRPGALMLIAARPGHGKTLLALDVLRMAARAGQGAWFFTLDYTQRDLDTMDMTGIQVDASDDISADYISRTMQDARPGSMAVIDYLQLLDQRRDFPPLADQVRALRQFAEARKIALVALSQVDRRFDLSGARLPGPGDIRLPNPVDLGQISRTCFLHDGQARITPHRPA